MVIYHQLNLVFISHRGGMPKGWDNQRVKEMKMQLKAKGEAFLGDFVGKNLQRK